MRVTRNFLGQGVSFEKERPRRKKASLKKFSKEILTTDGPNRDIFFSIRALSNFQKGAGGTSPTPLRYAPETFNLQHKKERPRREKY